MATRYIKESAFKKAAHEKGLKPTYSQVCDLDRRIEELVNREIEELSHELNEARTKSGVVVTINPVEQVA